MTVRGYARVSTDEQNLDRQLDALKNYGIDIMYCEKMSGTKKSRPELDRMLKEVEDGDTIVIESLSRLGRSVKNLAELMEIFNSRNIRLVSLKETIDTTTPTGKLLFSIMSSLAQFERDVLVERTQEGLAAARARGR
ncbi:MAG: recombinase family protein, partial [Lachnoclostridium sp.]|nr:recombinase family protein [Lachnoclostridium sp.]